MRCVNPRFTYLLYLLNRRPGSKRKVRVVYTGQGSALDRLMIGAMSMYLMYRCLHGTAPLYLMNSCTPTADVAGRQHLRSASQRKLIVPRYRLNSFGRRCFAVAGPSTWNSLSDSLRDPALSLNIF